MIKIVLDPNQHLVTDQPPVKPKAGETYLIQCKTYEDWSCDQYQWQFIGKKQLKDDCGTILLKNYYHIRLPGVKAGKGRARPNTSNKFTRAAYFIDERPGRILVTYAGDENVYIPNPHGNTKRDNPSA